MGQVEDEITPFLKARRAALDPGALGLPNGVTRRRVSGLRREEVAQLAGISVDYYTRIEQGRAPAISDAILDAIARALRLTSDEHTFLRNITAPNRRHAAGACAAADRPQVRPQIQELLDAMGDTVPAMIQGPGTDLLAWNRLAVLVYAMDFAAMPGCWPWPTPTRSGPTGTRSRRTPSPRCVPTSGGFPSTGGPTR